MLELVRLFNWKSFRNLTEFRIHSHAFIITVVGGNGSGKSNLLEAIRFACSLEKLEYDDTEQEAWVELYTVDGKCFRRTVSNEYYIDDVKMPLDEYLEKLGVNLTIFDTSLQQNWRSILGNKKSLLEYIEASDISGTSNKLSMSEKKHLTELIKFRDSTKKDVSTILSELREQKELMKTISMGESSSEINKSSKYSQLDIVEELEELATIKLKIKSLQLRILDDKIMKLSEYDLHNEHSINQFQALSELDGIRLSAISFLQDNICMPDIEPDHKYDVEYIKILDELSSKVDQLNGNLESEIFLLPEQEKLEKNIRILVENIREFWSIITEKLSNFQNHRNDLETLISVTKRKIHDLTHEADVLSDSIVLHHQQQTSHSVEINTRSVQVDVPSGIKGCIGYLKDVMQLESIEGVSEKEESFLKEHWVGKQNSIVVDTPETAFELIRNAHFSGFENGPEIICMSDIPDSIGSKTFSLEHSIGGRNIRSKSTLLSSVQQSLIGDYIFSDILHSTNRGTTLQLCEEYPSKKIIENGYLYQPPDTIRTNAGSGSGYLSDEYECSNLTIKFARAKLDIIDAFIQRKRSSLLIASNISSVYYQRSTVMNSILLRLREIWLEVRKKSRNLTLYSENNTNFYFDEIVFYSNVGLRNNYEFTSKEGKVDAAYSDFLEEIKAIESSCLNRKSGEIDSKAYVDELRDMSKQRNAIQKGLNQLEEQILSNMGLEKLIQMREKCQYVDAEPMNLTIFRKKLLETKNNVKDKMKKIKESESEMKRNIISSNLKQQLESYENTLNQKMIELRELEREIYNINMRRVKWLNEIVFLLNPVMNQVYKIMIEDNSSRTTYIRLVVPQTEDIEEGIAFTGHINNKLWSEVRNFSNGEGALVALAITVAIGVLNDDKVLIVDEIDYELDTKACYALVRCFRSLTKAENRQVFIASHRAPIFCQGNQMIGIYRLFGTSKLISFCNETSECEYNVIFQ